MSSSSLDALDFFQQVVLSPKGLVTLILIVVVLALMVRKMNYNYKHFNLTRIRQRATRQTSPESLASQKYRQRSPLSATSISSAGGRVQTTRPSSRNGARISGPPSSNVLWVDREQSSSATGPPCSRSGWDSRSRSLTDLISLASSISWV